MSSVGQPKSPHVARFPGKTILGGAELGAAGVGRLDAGLATASQVTSRTRGRGGVSALVLAAGLSTRMGRPKPLVSLAGRPILARTLDTLRASDVDEILVVLGAEADRVRQEIPLEDVRTVLNPDAAAGMSASLRAGLGAAAPSSEAFLVVLGDQPLVTPETVNTLLGKREASGARIVLPTYHGVRGNPVLLHRSLSKDIASITGDVGFRDVIRAHDPDVLEVPVEDPGVLIDLDTQDDVSQVEALMARGSPLDGLVTGRVR